MSAVAELVDRTVAHVFFGIHSRVSICTNTRATWQVKPCHTCIAMHTESIWVPEGRPIHLHAASLGSPALSQSVVVVLRLFTADGVN